MDHGLIEVSLGHWLAAVLFFLLLLYLWGIIRAYRTAGDGWKVMDRDVRLVFLLAVPLFRAAIQLLLWVDKLFYTPDRDRRRQLVRCTLWFETCATATTLVDLTSR